MHVSMDVNKLFTNYIPNILQTISAPAEKPNATSAITKGIVIVIHLINKLYF